MSVTVEQGIRFCGGVIFLIGVGVAFSAIGRRTTDPLAAMFFEKFTLIHIFGVAIVGLGLMGLGLAVAKQAEKFKD